MRISDWSSDVCSSDLVDIGSLREGILIPQIAVKMADSGASVFVVDKKGHAVPRSIRLGEMQGDKWVVLEGLRPGEKIVTNGVQKVMARSEEHTSELQSLMRISYAVFCLKKKTQKKQHNHVKRNYNT